MPPRTPHLTPATLILTLLASLTLSNLAHAQAPAAQAPILQHYTQAARTENPGFTGFSAQRGSHLHQKQFTTGKPDTPACTTCHAQDPKQPGQTRTGKPIAPMALSRSPQRYTDLAKTEKWFKRNCTEVIGRPCTAQEKGDWLTHMLQQ